MKNLADTCRPQQASMFPRPIDPMKFVRWEAVENGQRYLVGAFQGRRAGEIGKCVGIVSLRHAGGYEVVLEFGDGKSDSFAPMSLFPVIERGEQ